MIKSIQVYLQIYLYPWIPSKMEFKKKENPLNFNHIKTAKKNLLPIDWCFKIIIYAVLSRDSISKYEKWLWKIWALYTDLRKMALSYLVKTLSSFVCIIIIVCSGLWVQACECLQLVVETQRSKITVSKRRV